MRPHTAEATTENDGGAAGYRVSKSAPNSPGLSRKSKVNGCLVIDE